MKRRLIIAAILIALFAPKLTVKVEGNQGNGNALTQKQGDLRELPQYIAALMKKIPVTPGLAIAVVRGDKVIFSQGFGYRDVKAKLPVTP